MNRPTILYSAGCKFCRWTARTIVPGSFDVIPSRSSEGQRLLDRHHIRTDKRYLNWWYWDGMSLYASNHGGAAYALRDMTGWAWLGKPWVRNTLNRLDNWVKRWRPVLSKFIPQGPAIMRQGGQQCIVESI